MEWIVSNVIFCYNARTDWLNFKMLKTLCQYVGRPVL